MHYLSCTICPLSGLYRYYSPSIRVTYWPSEICMNVAGKWQQACSNMWKPQSTLGNAIAVSYPFSSSVIGKFACCYVRLLLEVCAHWGKTGLVNVITRCMVVSCTAPELRSPRATCPSAPWMILEMWSKNAAAT